MIEFAGFLFRAEDVLFVGVFADGLTSRKVSITVARNGCSRTESWVFRAGTMDDNNRAAGEHLQSLALTIEGKQVKP